MRLYFGSFAYVTTTLVSRACEENLTMSAAEQRVHPSLLVGSLEQAVDVVHSAHYFWTPFRIALSC